MGRLERNMHRETGRGSHAGGPVVLINTMTNNNSCSGGLDWRLLVHLRPWSFMIWVAGQQALMAERCWDMKGCPTVPCTTAAAGEQMAHVDDVCLSPNSESMINSPHVHRERNANITERRMCVRTCVRRHAASQLPLRSPL